LTIHWREHAINDAFLEFESRCDAPPQAISEPIPIVQSTEPSPIILSFNQHFNQELAEASETECDSEMSDFEMNNSGACFMMHATNSNNDDMTYAYAHIVSNNTIHRRRVMLDSCATTNLFKEGWATKSGGDPTVIQGLNGASPSGAAADALSVVGNSDVVMPGYISSQLPSNCVALLGRPAMRKLTNEHGFNMDFHLKQPLDSCHDLSFNNVSKITHEEHEGSTPDNGSKRKPKRMREVWLKPPTLPRKLPKLRNRGKSFFSRDGSKFIDGNLLCSTPNMDSNEMALNPLPKCLREGCKNHADPRPCSKHAGRSRKFCSHHCHRLNKANNSSHSSSNSGIENSEIVSKLSKNEIPISTILSKNEVFSTPEIKSSVSKSKSKSKHTVSISQKQMLKHLERKPIEEDNTDHVLQNQLAHQKVSTRFLSVSVTTPEFWKLGKNFVR
jgi:hypothetical protein